MSNPLFSTYSQGETRVTSSILAVFERLSFVLVEQILQELCQEPEFPLLSFLNQPAGKSSTPDGRIRASFAYWIETKITSNAIHTDQIRRHLTALDAETGVERQRLLVLTPDSKMPSSLAALGDERVAWASFDNLLAAIREIVEPDEGGFLSNRVIPSEYEQGMLRELARFLLKRHRKPHPSLFELVFFISCPFQGMMNTPSCLTQPVLHWIRQNCPSA